MKLIPHGWTIETPYEKADVYHRIASAGRTCYQSVGDDDGAFVRRIVKAGHHSVLEHVSWTVRFVVDRAVSHELVRHRLAAYSQESQRYVAYKGEVTFVEPHWFAGEVSLTREAFKGMLHEAEMNYHMLLQSGLKPEDARGVLPNCTATEIVMTANAREWRHVLKLRTSKGAHPDMKLVMGSLLYSLAEMYPAIFGENK
jgi:thymidylate synthase (FAD)